ncbi:MAG: 50S ribosomal protein L29 [Nanoarchaeota archaeon]
MKAKELRNLSEQDLTNKEAELRKNLMKLYGQVSTGTPPKNPGEIRQSKRTIAQILTIKGERKNKPAAAKTEIKHTGARPKQ